MLLPILIALGKISFGISFNVDTENPIIFEPNGVNEGPSQFGHSIALTNDPKIIAIVGAPLSSTHGALFRCSNRKCTAIASEYL